MSWYRLTESDCQAVDPLAEICISLWLRNLASLDIAIGFWSLCGVEVWRWMEDSYIDKNNNLVPFAEKDGMWDVDDNTSIKQTSELKPFRKGGNGNEYWTPNNIGTIPASCAETILLRKVRCLLLCHDVNTDA
ncbi:hypothetical protein FIBSPDRAFT_904864 [Athelia psychrophila]|uniref:Uncharacterized protein n=1 Tax=Athelia psychrophila TaxID=1759441 RepID=A0A167U754_9AGAM|nr:hypothetical protein FIBSPDRAFT_904864 [Fibularhizoctonia sp. CBS 109695]